MRASQQDRINFNFLRVIALAIIVLLLSMIVLLFIESYQAIKIFRGHFLLTDLWNPVEEEFGALAFVYGTMITSTLALFLAAPISVAVAIFLNEVLPHWAGHIAGQFVEMIAAIPSIVFGLWGLYFLAPWVKNFLSPFLKKTLGFLPFFQGPSFGIGILTASIILAIMIVPTITSICREVFKTIPLLQKEAALALGATRFEAITLTVLRPSFSGIVGAVVLGLGRALGETMAVAMVIGNSPQISKSFFAPAATMASVMANEYAEAESDLHISALCLVGLLLFVVTFVTNLAARTIVWRAKRGARSK